jgi:hypothetical protein
MIFFKLLKKIHLIYRKNIKKKRRFSFNLNGFIYRADANLQLQFTLEVYEVPNNEELVKVIKMKVFFFFFFFLKKFFEIEIVISNYYGS